MQNKFTDLTGSVWVIPDLDFGTVMRLKNDHGFDARTIAKENDKQLEGLLTGFKLVELLFVVLAVPQDLTIENFYSRFDGRVIDRATAPFIRAVAGILPSLERNAVETMLEKLPQMLEAGVAEMQKAMTVDG